ncbi:SMC family ATPase [Arthrobacter tecti]
MRIHRLEIQAFGPFAERQHVDFDALTEQGLFLLNGPTGAGKSSVLDAVCYALYGSVPGARQTAKRLRSDHAPENLMPEVVCEFSAGSRRLEVTRNPAWQRPAKRGNGTTPEQAKTLLRERVEGQWITRSTRNDEAGAELQSLLGMNREQFTRVVMLPQGEFAAFLRADAAPRAELLQRLFATDRFSTVEQLIADYAASAAARREKAESELDAVLARAMEEVRRHGLENDEWEDVPGEDGTAENQPGQPSLIILQDRLMSAVQRGRERVADLKFLRDAAAGKRSQLEDDRRNRTGYQRLQVEAESNRKNLLIAAELQKALENHRRAQVLEGPLQARDQCREELQLREESLRSAVTSLRRDGPADREVPELMELLSDERLEGLEVAHGRIREELAATLAAQPQERELTGLHTRIASAEQKVEEYASDAHRCAHTRKELEAKLEAGTADLHAAETASARAARLIAECEEVIGRLALHSEAETAEQSLEHLEDLHRTHLALFLEAKENWLEKLRLRLEQAAAELAVGLREGEPCPVCGGEEHPEPATIGDHALVSREEEEQARADQERAEQRLRETAKARDAAALEAAGLRARVGTLDPEDARETLRSLQQELAETELLASGIPALSAKKLEVERLLAELEGRQQELVRSESRESSLIAALREQAAALTLRVDAVRGDYSSVEERVAGLRKVEEGIGGVCSAISRLDHARESFATAENALQTRLADSGFERDQAVREALLPQGRAAEAERTIREAASTAHRIEIELQRPENLSAAALEREGGTVPRVEDIEEAARSEEDAATKLERAVLEVGLLEQSVVQLASYADRAKTLEERLEPLRRAHQLAKSVADTARGNGENIYKMSLATYVLAARLEQVADAATERLQQMSDGRYALVHSDAKSGNKKSGLGLHVTDNWTGTSRDTATLSGGESFMASLALALGLADVVQQESGGLDIETLFVDEGFGSLDEQSLEQVMDALENLRDGGRVVGLVSHVPELKQRIPAQLHVLKGRTGSTLRFVDQLQRV